MPYDQKLDKCVFSKVWETDAERLTVSLYSYNGGTKKLQISRENKDAHGEYRFGKLGRLRKDEIEAILPLIQEAVKNMD